MKCRVVLALVVGAVVFAQSGFAGGTKILLPGVVGPKSGIRPPIPLTIWERQYQGQERLVTVTVLCERLKKVDVNIEANVCHSHPNEWVSYEPTDKQRGSVSGNYDLDFTDLDFTYAYLVRAKSAEHQAMQQSKDMMENGMVPRDDLKFVVLATESHIVQRLTPSSREKLGGTQDIRRNMSALLSPVASDEQIEAAGTALRGLIQ